MRQETVQVAIPTSWLIRWPQSVILITCIALTLLAGGIDYATGNEVSVTVLYLLPIGLSAWFIGRRAGHWIARTSNMCCSMYC